MNKILLFCLVIFLTFPGYSQQSTYSRVRIYLGDQNPKALLKTGIDLTGFDKSGNSVTSELSSEELKRITEAGFRYEVLIEDVQKFYVERNLKNNSSIKNTTAANDLSSEWPVPANFTLGTCGGFLTVDAMVAQLDLMQSLYPNLITVKQSISDTITTVEGRPVYYVKISDNPTVAENEPQVLYTGMHHAREPIGMQHLLFYMWHLLENYATNEEISNVVDNTELYFVPVINVDGYQYNITTNPDGGGMWRKNRRVSGGGNFGIDVNRNYGYMWGFDDEGSSPDPAAETYRGPSAFSEPETRMMKYFCEGHDFKIALNYHSYSNLFLYAWGWSPEFTPDESLLNAYASAMTAENSYTYGPGYSTIYATNGGSDDWMYGEQTTKPKILAYTPEVGSTGFWPTEEEIIPLCQENMLASFTAAKLVGKFGKISDSSPLFLYQDNGYLTFDVKRLGMQYGDFTVSITPLGNGFASVGSPLTISGMSLLEKRSDSIAYQLSSVNQVGDTLNYVLVLDNGMYTVSDTVHRIFGYPYTLFSDNLDAKDNWTGLWNLTGNSYYSAPTSMTDSPFGSYGNNANRSISLINPISINPTLLTVLEFRAHWALENDYDFVQLKISSDNGITWTPLSAKFTNPGTVNQLIGQPLYDGTQTEWVREAVSLNPWQDKNIKLRFTLDSDQGTVADGFYFDDLVISYLLDPTAIKEVNPAQLWLGGPSPNPSMKQVRLSYRIPANAQMPEMKVYSASGKEQFALPVTQQEGFAEFSVENWPSGVYFVRLDAKGIPAQVRKLLVY